MRMPWAASRLSRAVLTVVRMAPQVTSAGPRPRFPGPAIQTRIGALEKGFYLTVEVAGRAILQTALLACMEELPLFELDSVAIDAALPLPELLLSVERQIAGAPVEVGFAFDADGNVLVRRVGKVDVLRFSGEDMQAMQGHTMTHNHPGRGFFSVADIEFACTVDLSEIRAVAGKRVYSLKRPAAGWNLGLFTAKYESEYRKIVRSYQQRGISRAAADLRMNNLVRNVVKFLSLPLQEEKL